MAATETKDRISTHGAFLDVGGLWVRYDAIATIKEVVSNPMPGGDHYCQVVLFVPGHKTLGVSCTAEELLKTIAQVAARSELGVGYERARGMRNAGA